MANAIHALHRRWKTTQTTEYPHEGGCGGCREEKRCNVCGKQWKDRLQFIHDRCTNGRCNDCHRKHCTSGGGTSAGHGYGKVG